MDMFSKEKRSQIMRAIKSTNTKAEILLARSLWKLGHRYRKNNKKVFGKPDITFANLKIAIFIDGEFFHGFEWETRREKIATNREYWIPKIERNIIRDVEVNEFLASEGWIVLRFWSKYIKSHTEDVISSIEEAIALRRSIKKLKSHRK